jgi:ABC-type glycerol-3-phosphate transport system permease component
MTVASYVVLSRFLGHLDQRGNGTIPLIPKNFGDSIFASINIVCSAALSAITFTACRAIHFLTSRNAPRTAAVSAIITGISLIANVYLNKKYAHFNNKLDDIYKAEKALKCNQFHWGLKELFFSQMSQSDQTMLKDLDESQKKFFEEYKTVETHTKEMIAVYNKLKLFFDGAYIGSYKFFNVDNLKDLNEKFDNALPKTGIEKTSLETALSELQEKMQIHKKSHSQAEGDLTELGKFADWQETLKADDSKLKKHLESLCSNEKKQDLEKYKKAMQKIKNARNTFSNYIFISMIIAVPSLLISLYAGAMTAAPVINRYWKKM